jgi:hypothetical protein
MREKIIKLYTYDELSDDAKRKAREWYSQVVASDYDAEHVLDDAATIAEFMGMDIRQRLVKRMDGTHWKVSVYYSLYDRSAGAAFDGVWRAARVAKGGAVEYAPQDVELARIAGAIERIATLRPDAVAHISSASRKGQYDIATHPPEDTDGVVRTQAEWVQINLRENALRASLAEAFANFAYWIYRRISEDYEYYTGNEGVLAEGIIANEYEFTADGKRES